MDDNIGTITRSQYYQLRDPSTSRERVEEIAYEIEAPRVIADSRRKKKARQYKVRNKR